MCQSLQSIVNSAVRAYKAGLGVNLAIGILKNSLSRGNKQVLSHLAERSPGEVDGGGKG